MAPKESAIGHGNGITNRRERRISVFLHGKAFRRERRAVLLQPLVIIEADAEGNILIFGRNVLKKARDFGAAAEDGKP